jgi:hypothetical protein
MVFAPFTQIHGYNRSASYRCKKHNILTSAAKKEIITGGYRLITEDAVKQTCRT